MTIPITRRPALDNEDLTLLRLIAEGLPIESVARRVDMSERTVRRRTRAICDRLGVPAPISAVVWAVRHGLL
ncbi:LuxR C-terminal-related transcriptional regulator [Phytohabitans sp. ZYX-F-186]|uniref:LuxR C-terminal-related transcriptional regulator n=1 Tax=Phytohabitans maris TaxID=3071409 RepID=A0ABU0ZPS8_9ACTN|nr:helix-turn-helix domain-containing protein [Phytohabitans sp. ZYX-F-186]MDQ7909034.1 LuxR C-terminal-related transcriptional regulator [Phytohabitans sp. ZYX-F-186]